MGQNHSIVMLGQPGLEMLANTSELTPLTWLSGQSTFTIALDVCECNKLNQNVTVGDYTFSNGSVGYDVRYRDILADDFDLRHTHSGDNTTLRTGNTLKNARHLMTELELYEAASFAASSTPVHNELRRLLFLPDSLRYPAYWLLYMTPQFVGPALTGWITAKAFDAANVTETWADNGITANQLQTWSVVAITTLANAIIARLSEAILPEPALLSPTQLHYINLATSWARRQARRLFDKPHWLEDSSEAERRAVQEMALNNGIVPEWMSSMPLLDANEISELTETLPRASFGGLTNHPVAEERVTLPGRPSAPFLRERITGKTECGETVVDLGG